jgi:hypothetical protein
MWKYEKIVCCVFKIKVNGKEKIAKIGHSKNVCIFKFPGRKYGLLKPVKQIQQTGVRRSIYLQVYQTDDLFKEMFHKNECRLKEVR